jgi:aspartate racemase
MKTIGLIGGMSWESSLEYYRLINEGVHTRLGGVSSAKSVMVSVDFAEIEALQRIEDWNEQARLMIQAALQVQAAGADFLVICTNTLHKLADIVQSNIKIPLLHIADAAGQRAVELGMKRVGLLGTRFTMEQDFYRARLMQGFGLEVLIPDAAERETVHRVIYDELVVGIIREESRAAYRQIIAGLAQRGAQGIILGCTEIGLLVQSEDSPVPLLDTTVIHAEAAVDLALQ